MPKQSFVGAISQALTSSAKPVVKKSPRMENSLRSSARVSLPGEKPEDNDSKAANLARVWQQKVWQYYDEVGELWYAVNFIGACLSRCVLTVGLPDDKGIVGPAFDDEGNPKEGAEGAVAALELIRGLKSDIGGQAQLLRMMGINISAAGEFHLVGRSPDENPTDLAAADRLLWEVLSTEEFRRVGKDYERRDTPGATPETIDSDSVHAVRIWRSHPRFSILPDSSIRAQLDILEELVLLTREVRGETLSRLSSAGLLLVPSEINYSGVGDDADEEEGGDPFTEDLISTMATAISDKGSAAQTVPFVVRAAAEFLKPEYFRRIDLSPANPSDSTEKRKETVQRFAQGVDLPVEVVTGHASTTFANAVQIDDSTFKAHIEPVLEILCDALTAGYLRPSLRALGIETPVVVYYDSAELVSRPNRSQDAKDGHDRLAISDASLRSATGFADSDAPDEEELGRRIEQKQRMNARATEQSSPEQQGAPTKAPGAPIQQGPLDGNEVQVLAASIETATEVTVERAIKRAGARLRSKAAKEPAIRDQLSQVPDPEVAITLGPSLVNRLSANDDLFLGEFDTLWQIVARKTGDQNYADRLREACKTVSLERMYQPRRPFPFELLPKYEDRAVLKALDHAKG